MIYEGFISFCIFLWLLGFVHTFFFAHEFYVSFHLNAPELMMHGTLGLTSLQSVKQF